LHELHASSAFKAIAQAHSALSSALVKAIADL